MGNSILGLRTTIYRVPNIEQAKEWYKKAFETDPYFDEPFYVGFNIGGYEMGLQPDKATTGDNILTYWGVNNINQQYNRFIALGATGFEEPQSVGGEIVVAAVKDPWGNVLGLIYNPHFKTA